MRDLLISNVGVHEPGSRIFSQLELTDAPSDLSRRHSEKEVRDSAAEEEDEEEYYDDTPDDDTVPFPVKRSVDRPSWVHKTDLLDLASRVLRDSDHVPNPELKDEVFILVVRGWGELLDEFSKQGVLDEAAAFGANAMLEAGYFDESSLEDVREALSLLLPTFTIVGALYTCLVSTKLAVNAKNALSTPGFVEDVQGASAAAIFMLALSLPGFGDSLKKIGDHHGKKWFVGFVLAVLGERAYMNQDLSNDDEIALRKFIVQMTGGRHRFRDDAQKKEKLDAFDTKLKKERLLSSPKRLSEGETIIDRLGEKTSE
ncbi:hypothetical protein ASG53_14695 [Sanguibacter sp. Leaf3]|nr:hypothetical protein ASG53_14695 [Sanguibacter sp. Leaf3]